MILSKVKKQKGSALIICIAILLFLSVLGSTNFKSSRSEVAVSSTVYASNMLFQAAESSIEITMHDNFNDEDGLTELLNMNPNDIIYSCKDYDGKVGKTSDCEKNNYNSNKSIKTYAKITKNKDTECLSYGSSEQISYCYVIRSESEIPSIDGKKEVHIQEVQINTVNLNNNGVYEM